MTKTGLFAAVAIAAMVVPGMAADAAPRNHHNSHNISRKAPNRAVRQKTPAQRHHVQNSKNVQLRKAQQARKAEQVRKTERARAAQRSRQTANKAYRQGVRDAQRSIHSSNIRRAPTPYYNNGYPVYSSAAYRSPAYNNQYWWGENGQVYCRRNDGTTGTIVGAVAGGVLGNMIAGAGDKTVGAVVGGALGAFLGREIDRGGARCR